MPRPKRKYGNPNGNAVEGYRGVSTEALRAKRLAKKTPAGQQDENRLVSYDPERVRDAVESGLCPFCGAGPYNVVSIHAVMSHGVTARELRQMAGLPLSASLTSPELHRKRQEIIANRSDWEEARSRGTASSQAAGVYRLALAARATRREGERSKRDPLICQLYKEGRLLKDIATEAEVDVQCVKATLTRLGLLADMRSRRGKIDPADWGAKSRKLSRDAHEEVIRLVQSGLPQREVGEQFGIAQSRVSQIVREHFPNGIECQPNRRQTCVECGNRASRKMELGNDGWRCEGRVKCAQRARKAARTGVAITCAGCGQSFPAPARGRMPSYCSTSCGQRHRRSTAASPSVAAP